MCSMTENGMSDITYHEAVDFLLPRHYSGRIPSISYAFGWYEDGNLQAVCTFGIPASPALCSGICGTEYRDKVIELNRLCRLDTFTKPLSQFVAWCLRQLSAYNLIVVSYSDTAMNHHGYIYQACNFLYTGETKARTDKYTDGNRHSRHYDNGAQDGKRKIRSAKHRYVYFASDKQHRKLYRSVLRYAVFQYPKGDNSTYCLGEYLQPNILDPESKIGVLTSQPNGL